MKVGADIPNEGDLPLQLGVREMARAAETAGADSVWANDHLVMVDSPDSEYPYSPDRRIPWQMDRNFFDTLTTCAFMSAVTDHCRVGTDVMILPQRPVLALAKTVATLDRLNNGRMVLGVGIGWFRKEMEALGFDFRTRGKRANEMIGVLRDCWTGRPQVFRGTDFEIGEGVVVEPTPSQGPDLPVLVGGHSSAACRRAARLGSGWIGVINADNWEEEFPPLTPLLADLGEEREAAGTADAPFELVLKLHTRPADLTGGELPDKLRAVAALGFTEVIIQPFWDTVDEGAEHVSAAVRAVS